VALKLRGKSIAIAAKLSEMVQRCLGGYINTIINIIAYREYIQQDIWIWITSLILITIVCFQSSCIWRLLVEVDSGVNCIFAKIRRHLGVNYSRMYFLGIALNLAFHNMTFMVRVGQGSHVHCTTCSKY
jgi:hypothetical protein